MDLPKLLTNAAPEQTGSLIEQKVKQISFSEKDKQKSRINIVMVLDLKQEEVYFEPIAWKDGAEDAYYYLGNNQAAANQLYAVRETKAFIHFWTGRMRGILQNIMDFLKCGELYELLKQCREAELFDDSGIRLDKIRNWNPDVTIDYAQKTFLEDGSKISADKLLASLCQLDSKEKLILIVPAIAMTDGTRVIISQHQDYYEKIEAELQGNGAENSSRAKKQKKVCHICGQYSGDVDTIGFSTKLSKKSVGKVFVTTQINYAPFFDKKAHETNFAICKDCYTRWFSGEKSVMEDYRLWIAHEPAVVLFDGIFGKLNREEISSFEKKLDAAFNLDKVYGWAEELSDVLEDQKLDRLYEFHILFYQTDGKSCAVKKTIESVSNVRFNTIMSVFKKIETEHNLSSFKLGTLYALIPVRTNDKREQLNIARILDLYDAVMKAHPISLSNLMEWYAEAMDCGNRHLRSGELKNEKNLLKLDYAIKKQDRKTSKMREYYFREMTRHYLAFIEVIRELGLLEGEMFSMEEKEKTTGKSFNEQIEEREAFLEKHHFSESARGLYYLGAVMYQVGEMQAAQGHKAKPILDKVTYSGMSQWDIIRLREDVLEKIQQYRRTIIKGEKQWLTVKAERFAAMADSYLGNLPARTDLRDEHANLFYLMSGYSGCTYIGVNHKNEGEDENVG